MHQTLSLLRQELGLHSVGLSIALLALSGCGGGDDSSSATTDTAASPAAPAVPSMPSSGGDTATAGAPGGGVHGGSGEMPQGSGDSSGGSAPMGEANSSGSSGAMSGMHGGGDAMMAGTSGGMGSGMMPGASGGMESGGMLGGAMPGGAMPGGQASGFGGPPKSVRPTDFSKWSDDDFHSAVRERDEIVLKALNARTAAKPADAAVATLLTALLVTSAEVPATPAQTPGGSFGAPGSGGMQMPGMDSPMGSGAGSGMVPLMETPMGAGAHGATPGAAGQGRMQGNPGTSSESSSDSSAVPPTSSVTPKRRSVDTLEMMLLEAATAYFQEASMMQLSAGAPGGAQQGGGMHGAPGSDAAMMSNASGSSGAMHGASGSSGAMMMPGAMGGQMQGGTPGYPGASGVGGAQQPGNLDTRELTQNIIGNLVKNGSPVAWQTIFALASGTLATAVTPIEATQMVAESLLENLEKGGPQVEQVLLAILEGKAQLPPESQSVFLAVMASASSSAADKITGFGKVKTLSTPAAGGGGFGGSSGMGMASGMGMGMGMGMPTPGGQGMVGGNESAAGFGGGSGMSGGDSNAASSVTLLNPVKGFSDAELTRAAAFLWGPKCVTAIAEQLKAATDPMAAGELLKLAATIPNQKTREATYAALSKVHSLGADTLRGTGVFNQIHDPGLLVVLKSLPRPKAGRAEAQTMDSWSMTSEEMVLALRDRMKALSTQPGKLTAVSDDFPVKLHRNAISEYAGVLTLPGPSSANLKDSAPSQTKVYYARTSFTPQKPKDQNDIKDHYEARASGVTRPDQAKQLLWIDGVKGGTTGVRRSMDIIIQAKAGGAGGGGGGAGLGGSGFGGPGVESGAGGGFGGAPGAGGQASAYSIEIIVVETADPKGSSTAAAESKPEKN